MRKYIVLSIMLLIPLIFLSAKSTEFSEKILKEKDTSLKTNSEMIIVKEKTKSDTFNMEYEGPDIRLAEEKEREAIIASLDSLSFTEAYKAVKNYERALYLTKYLENKPNRKDIIKSFIDTTWTKKQSLNENISRSQYIRLITAIWTSKIIWDNSNKEDRIFMLNFLIEEFMPKLLERFNLLLSEWGQPGIDNKKLGLNAIHERWIDIISSFYADIFKDYKILEHGGHHPVKYRRYTGGYFIQHIVIDPEKFIDNLKILRKLIIEEK